MFGTSPGVQRRSFSAPGHRIDSAAGRPRLRILLIDDRSTDGSAEIIRHYAACDERIRPIFHRENAGLAATLNEGLKEARNDLIVRMDQDDVALAKRIGAQVEFMLERPEIAVAGSFVYHMGRRPADDHLVRVPAGHEELVRTLARENCIYHPSVIMRRQQILNPGGYRAEFHNSEDYDLWLRVAEVSRLANLPGALAALPFLGDRHDVGAEMAAGAVREDGAERQPSSGMESRPGPPGGCRGIG